MSEYHRLLNQQIELARQSDGIDQDRLFQLMSDAYEEHDRDRRRSDRAQRLMEEELEEANAELQKALADSKLQGLRFKAALDNMPLGLAMFDKAGGLVVCNQAWLSLYDIPNTAQLSQTQLSEILSHSQALGMNKSPNNRVLALEHCALRTDQPCQIEQEWPNKRDVIIKRSPISDGGYLDMIEDITETKQAREKIDHMASFDALTDLPNRVLFRNHLIEAIKSSGRGQKSAVMCLDLDRFKAVNDTLGHPIGDALLIEVSKRLQNSLRATDTAARLGGDEFAIVARQVKNENEINRMAQRIINAISQPYMINGHQIIIGVSIGIEMIESPKLHPDEMIRNADLALYQAKAKGRSTYCFFVTDMHTSLNRRRELELELRMALKRNEFEVHYQPQYCIKKEKICGYEALVRWRSPIKGLVPPMEFISLCEEIGLIDELGEWVLRRACTDAVQLGNDITMAVNLSPVQFKTKKLVDSVKAILAETGINPQLLELEVTESVMISNTKETLAILTELKALGVKISLDDFGTGYSSLSYIRNFPFDKIKIDQSFVRGLGVAGDSLAIIRAVSGICTSLGIVSTAEGVETQEQYQILKNENCDMIQGYLFGKPTPMSDMKAHWHAAETRKIA